MAQQQQSSLFCTVPFVYRVEQTSNGSEIRRAAKHTRVPLIDSRVNSQVKRLYELVKDSPLPHTPDWHLIRAKTLTASNIASCLDIKGAYKSMQAYFNERTLQGVAARVNTFFTGHGNDYELEAGQVYSCLTGNCLVREPLPCITHPRVSFLAATPDFITHNGILVEIKCPVRRVFGHWIPELYYPQLQLQMEVTGTRMCHFVQYKPGSLLDVGQIDILEVPHSPDWFDAAFPILNRFNELALDYRVSHGLNFVSQESFSKARDELRVKNDQRLAAKQRLKHSQATLDACRQIRELLSKYPVPTAASLQPTPSPVTVAQQAQFDPSDLDGGWFGDFNRSGTSYIEDHVYQVCSDVPVQSLQTSIDLDLNSE